MMWSCSVPLKNLVANNNTRRTPPRVDSYLELLRLKPNDRTLLEVIDVVACSITAVHPGRNEQKTGLAIGRHDLPAGGVERILVHDVAREQRFLVVSLIKRFPVRNVIVARMIAKVLDLVGRDRLAVPTHARALISIPGWHRARPAHSQSGRARLARTTVDAAH